MWINSISGCVSEKYKLFLKSKVTLLYLNILTGIAWSHSLYSLCSNFPDCLIIFFFSWRVHLFELPFKDTVSFVTWPQPTHLSQHLLPFTHWFTEPLTLGVGHLRDAFPITAQVGAELKVWNGGWVHWTSSICTTEIPQSFLSMQIMSFPILQSRCRFFANFPLWENGYSMQFYGQLEGGIKNTCLTSYPNWKYFVLKDLQCSSFYNQ